MKHDFWSARLSGIANAHPWAILVLPVAIAVHSVPFFTHLPTDFVAYVSYWYERLTTLGFDAFSSPFSNYTPPYLYLLWVGTILGRHLPAVFVVKLVALFGACLLSWGLFSLFKTLDAMRPGVSALSALLLPSVVLNTSLLGQADTFWVAACVLALSSAIRDRLPWVAFWSGVAFAFKAQAVFFAPFVFHLFLTRRAPWWCWTIPFPVYVAAMLPAWLKGWNWWYLVNVYFRQANWQPDDRVFVSNGGSWWTVFGYYWPDIAIRVFPLGYLLAAVATLCFLRIPGSRSPAVLLIMATLSAVGLPFLLPGMHERFFILGDVLAFTLAVFMRTRPAIIGAMLIQAGSAIPVASWAYDIRKVEIAAPFLILGGLMIVAEILKKEIERETASIDRSVPLAKP